MIKRFCWGSVRVKGNVTELTHLVLADYGSGTPFLVYCSRRKHHLVFASISDQLKWGFIILKTNTKKGMIIDGRRSG